MTQTQVISRVFIKRMDSADVHVNDDIGENNDPDKGHFQSFHTKCIDSADVHVNDDIGENNDPDKGPYPQIYTDIFEQKVWQCKNYECGH